jgi:2-succinyl-6-hydroxy-2,4-cyclohexadiene-1-carboxylate synthase
VPETVVLLHGFGGTRRTWDGVAARLERERYRPLAIELPGHGHAAGERPITFAACAKRVLAGAPDRFTLCGYSMGGRVALHTALAAPGRISRLVLISCSAGIEEEAARGERRRAEETLAEQLEDGRFEEFLERWSAQPLFAHDPPRVQDLAQEDQRRNRPEALAAVLRGIGAGRMQPLWRELAQLGMPAVVLVGERDHPYHAIARRMAAALGRGRLVRVRGGHRLALENPAAVARALQGIDA